MITAHWSSLLIVENCGFPLWPAPIMISQNFLMLALFGDFYRKSYLQPKGQPQVAVVDAAAAVKKKEINDTNNNDNNNAKSASTTPTALRTGTINGVTKRH